MSYLTARAAGLIACHACGRLHNAAPPSTPQYCTRCKTKLHSRKPHSLSRTWALLVAATILYIPANLLPVMHTTTFKGAQDDTIMSGIVLFWKGGEWSLAIIIFVASILVPLLKLTVLAVLAITAQRGYTQWLRERAMLYRIVEFIGRWSMLDVFVITLTVALVRFQSFALITAGPGTIAFGAVVILTMLASLQFDSRLLWDPLSPAPDRQRTPIQGNAHDQ